MKLAIVILNFNGLDDTLACLDSIRKLKNDDIFLETIVVDNFSSDGSQEALSKIEDINFIQNQDNLGYAGGNNVGIKYALKQGADAVLILNNDTIVDQKLILNLVTSLDRGDVISPKIFFAKGFEFHKLRYSPKDLGKVIWSAGGEIDWSNVLGKHLGVDEVDRGQFGVRKQITFATGACMFVKREVFEKIGYFDEKYFLYLEDMDFCMRAKKAGFRIIFEPSAVVWHKNASSSGGSGSALQDYFISRNRLLIAFKFASIRTKFALFRHVLGQIKNPIKRKALVDFLTFNFGKGSYIK